MIYHLFNNSEFSKNDFNYPLNSNEFSELIDMYGEELQIFKFEILMT